MKGFLPLRAEGSALWAEAAPEQDPQELWAQDRRG